MKFIWEHISSNTYRAKVIVGWVLRVFDVDAANCETTSESMVFIPDPRHDWKIT